MDNRSFARKVLTSRAAEPLISAACRLTYSDALRHALVAAAERQLDRGLGTAGKGPSLIHDPSSAALTWERTMVAKAILQTFDRAAGERLASPHYLTTSAKLWTKALFGTGQYRAQGEFEHRFGCGPPWFLVISPGNQCNLHCSGCYADSGPGGTRLPWKVLDQVITQAESLWGVPLVVFSGGEPLAYRSEGRDLLDIVEKHPGLLYLMFTNGTLIDERVAERLGRLGCLTPALSLEGMREQTDARRGPGTFARVRRAMSLLREAGVLFGVSMTATKDSCDDLLSDEFVDFCFRDQGAFYGFVFMYMAMGRSADVDLMPSAEQRLLLWRRTWELMARREVFLFDFWNHASLVHGCLAAGRPGGYLHIDWQGNVTPCVFAPYAGANIIDIFEQGGDLNDVWQKPLFADMRRWQREHDPRTSATFAGSGWLRPCPIRDHYSDFRSCVVGNQVPRDDQATPAVLDDEEYTNAMVAHGLELQAQTAALGDHVYGARPPRPGAGT